MWWAVAAAAVPYVMSALQDKPKKPGAPARTGMPDRSGQVNQMLDSAFNPNNQSYQLASAATADQVNRLLARSGHAGSSGGAQLMGNTQAQLAQAWIENQAQRQSQALGAAANYDRGVAQVSQGNNDAAYQYDRMMYEDQLKRNANQVQGVSNMIGAGVGAYNQDRMMTAYEAALAGRGGVQSATFQEPMAVYGTPGGSSPSPYDPGGAYAPSGGYNRFPTPYGGT
jgi:hypothetical protein